MSDIRILAKAVLSAPNYERYVQELGNYAWCCPFCYEPSPNHTASCATHLAEKVLGEE